MEKINVKRMRVIFAGVGEACDENLPNTSAVILAFSEEGPRQVLLDCGFTGAHTFWRSSPAPLELGYVWISHFHGDHFLGLPLLLLRFWEQGRQKPLCIIGPEGIQDRTRAAMDLAYARFRPKIQYPLSFKEVSPGQDLDHQGLLWSFAAPDHSAPCLALRLDWGSQSLYFSGDGSPTAQTLSLAADCELVIHEAFGLDEGTAGHGSVEQCLAFAEDARARALALVHLNRDIRRARGDEIRSRLAGIITMRAFLPEPDDLFDVGSAASV
jgi:ribonuclease BN (tRNA processing enzyme)